jgi:cobalt-zinc-cadmium efflux system membrane fusion protein
MKKLYILALSIVLFSCKETKTEEPVAADDTMVTLLYNLNLRQWK